MNEKSGAFLRVERLAKGKVEGYEQWDEIPLNTDVVVIGRPSKKPDAIPPDIKILGDDYVSRNHAEIYFSFSDASFMLRDNGSLNGTFLNGEMIERNRACPLKDHDLIGFSKISGDMRVILRFRTSYSTLPPWIEEKLSRPAEKQGFAISIAARRIFVDGKEIPLTKKEFMVIEVLYNNKGNACSIDDISWEVWGKEGAGDELIAKYISRLREKIELEPSKPRYIVTVPGRHGCYRLEM